MIKLLQVRGWGAVGQLGNLWLSTPCLGGSDGLLWIAQTSAATQAKRALQGSGLTQVVTISVKPLSPALSHSCSCQHPSAHLGMVSAPHLSPDSQLQVHTRNVKVVFMEHMVPFCWFGPIVWKHTVLSSLLSLKFHVFQEKFKKGEKIQHFLDLILLSQIWKTVVLLYNGKEDCTLFLFYNLHRHKHCWDKLNLAGLKENSPPKWSCGLKQHQ